MATPDAKKNKILLVHYSLLWTEKSFVFSGDESHSDIVYENAIIFDSNYYKDEPQDSIPAMNCLFDFMMNADNQNKEFLRIINKENESFFIIESNLIDPIKHIIFK